MAMVLCISQMSVLSRLPQPRIGYGSRKKRPCAASVARSFFPFLVLKSNIKKDRVYQILMDTSYVRKERLMAQHSIGRTDAHSPYFPCTFVTRCPPLTFDGWAGCSACCDRHVRRNELGYPVAHAHWARPDTNSSTYYDADWYHNRRHRGSDRHHY